MKVLDPGHYYELDHLDGDDKQYLYFVKREGEGFPGNKGHHEGTNIQEVLRALIDRVIYLDNQTPHQNNLQVIHDLRRALWNLEERAAERHGRTLALNLWPESEPICGLCGHIQCERKCHASKSK